MRGEGLRVEKYGSDGAELWFPDGTSLPVGHYSGEYQLHWRLQGCPRGTPHLQVATSTTVRDPCDLWCAFCMYSEEAWRQQGMRVLPACELSFMDLLRRWGVDREFSLQVVPAFWPWPMDFFHMQQGYFVQVDGRCHWVAMYHHSTWVVLWRDMMQNMAAVQQGGRLVRVHTEDLGNADCIAVALESAAMGYTLVLTPSYSTALVRWGSFDVPYLQLLKWLVPNCQGHTDGYGNHTISPM